MAFFDRQSIMKTSSTPRYTCSTYINSKESAGSIACFESDSMVVYFHINVYEEFDPDGTKHIVVDINNTYPDGRMMNGEHRSHTLIN